MGELPGENSTRRQVSALPGKRSLDCEVIRMMANSPAPPARAQVHGQSRHKAGPGGFQFEKTRASANADLSIRVRSRIKQLNAMRGLALLPIA